jgi:hypothetical protein
MGFEFQFGNVNERPACQTIYSFFSLRQGPFGGGFFSPGWRPRVGTYGILDKRREVYDDGQSCRLSRSYFSSSISSRLPFADETSATSSPSTVSLLGREEFVFANPVAKPEGVAETSALPRSLRTCVGVSAIQDQRPQVFALARESPPLSFGETSCGAFPARLKHRPES